MKRYNQSEELKAINLTQQNNTSKQTNKTNKNCALFETAACEIKYHNSPETNLVLIMETFRTYMKPTAFRVQAVNRPCGRAVLLGVMCEQCAAM